MLDGNIDEVIRITVSIVTDAIWLGTMNDVKARLTLNGANDPATIQRAHQLIAEQSDPWVRQIYSRYRDNGKIKWKESIKKVVGLEVSREKGLDV